MSINSLVLKVASRCNLNCSYCYMYNLGDTTYRDQPKFMSRETASLVIEKVRDYCVKNNVPHFLFVFHGGEPLLIDKSFFRFFVEKCNRELEGVAKPYYSIQTNGVLVNDEWSQLLLELDVKIGFSIDGEKEIHDKYRVDHAGRGSYDDVLIGMETYKRNGGRLASLCVLDVKADPISTYQHLQNLGVKRYNILLPDQNYRTTDFNGDTPTGDWLIKLFDHWFHDENKIEVVLFKQIIDLILDRKDDGGQVFGTGLSSALVIETNGDIEPEDTLKTCGHGFTKINKSIYKHDFEDVMDDALAELVYKSHHYLPKKCLACPVQKICGGGYITHRYRDSNGFDNPTVYCEDMAKLITHIQFSLLQLLPEEKQEQFSSQFLSYEEIWTEIAQKSPSVQNEKEQFLRSFAKHQYHHQIESFHD